MSELGRLYDDNEVIVREGDVGEEMFVIQTGKVKITKNVSDGEMTLAVLESGEIFGEMALFDKKPRSANAVAAGQARVLSIDKRKLFKTINRDPTLVFKILTTMSSRVRKLTDEVMELRNRKA
jgi:CRP-like cAMP-binding protein